MFIIYPTSPQSAYSLFFAFVPHCNHKLSARHGMHRTVRVDHYFIPQATFHIALHFLFPSHVPNAGKAVFVNRSILFCKNISARVKYTPFGRPCIQHSLTSWFVLQQVLTTCRSLVLLHTFPSILTSSYFIPPNPNKVFAVLTGK